MYIHCFCREICCHGGFDPEQPTGLPVHLPYKAMLTLVTLLWLWLMHIFLISKLCIHEWLLCRLSSWRMYVTACASVLPGLLAPAFVTCSTNAGEGLVKLRHMQWHTYLDVWRSGTFPLYNCKAAFWIQETSPRPSDVERSVVLQTAFAIGSALTYLLFFRECATPPHVQVHHCTWPGLLPC